MGDRLLVFGVLLIIGIVLYVVWVFFAQRQVMYMSLLLYRQGDADRYLKELNSLSSRVLFYNKQPTKNSNYSKKKKGGNEKNKKMFLRATT